MTTKLASPLRPLEDRIIVRSDEADDTNAVAQTAEQIDAGSIVMGSAGGRGVEAILIGNTTERVLPITSHSG